MCPAKIWASEWQAAGPLWQGLGLGALAMGAGRIDCGLWRAGWGDWGEAGDGRGGGRGVLAVRRGSGSEEQSN